MTPSPTGGAVGGRHVVLVGLMGAGKSTVGALVAARMARPFVDTDELVEIAGGKTVAEIFTDAGEAAFRELERVAVADACASPEPLVIACGGGAVLDPANRSAIGGAGVVVWLRASAGRLAERVADAGIRPLLAGGQPVDTLERLQLLRAESYQAVADVIVDTDTLDADAVAERVLEEVAACAA
jgi:shikimate kinase